MKLDYRRTFFLGLAFLSVSAFWQLYDNIIPLMLQNTFGIGETITGTVMALDNVLALFLLPFFGALSDRTDTRLGKRTPFIVFGTLAAVVFMILIPVADNMKSFPLFFVSLGAVLFAMSTYRSPAVALMPDLTPKPLRSKANSIINLMGAVGGIVTLITISLLVPKESNPSYLPVFVVIAVLMISAVAVLLFTIKEKKLGQKVKEEYPEDAEDDEEENSRTCLQM